MPQCLKLVFPAQGTLSGVIDNREHLPAAVLQHPQNGIVSLLGHLPVPAGGDKGGINVDGQVVGGQAAAEPPFDVITAAAGKMRHLLLAVGTAIDTVRNLAYLLRGKPLGVEEARTILHAPRFCCVSTPRERDRSSRFGCAEYGARTQSHDCTSDENESRYTARGHSH